MKKSAYTDEDLSGGPATSLVKGARQSATSYASALAHLAQTVSDIYLLVDAENRIRFINPAAETLFASPVSMLLNKPLSFLLPGFVPKNAQPGDTVDVSLPSAKTMSLCLQSMVNLPGGGSHWLFTVPTAVQRERELLIRSRELLELTYSAVNDGVIAIQEDGSVEFINAVACELLGVSSEDRQAWHIDMLFQCVDVKSRTTLLALIDSCLFQGITLQSPGPILLGRKQAKPQRVVGQFIPVRNAWNKIDGALLVLRAENFAVAADNRQELHVSYDALTRLPNRQAFEAEIRQALSIAQESDTSYGLLLMDIYQFKLINDTCGHGGGDELLRQLAKLFQSKLRNHDVLARMGSDEFGLLLKNSTLAGAQRVADLLLRAVQDFRFYWDAREIKIGICVGAVTINSASESASQVLSYANTACSLAREEGRNKIHFYTHDPLAREHRSQVNWVIRIHEAMADNRLQLYQQAIIPLQREDKIPHFEVLIRLIDEYGQVIGPGEFIPAAERYGLMDDIDRWVVTGVMDYLSERKRQNLPEQSYAVNLSGVSMGDSTFVDFVVEEMNLYDFDPNLLHFELTETAAVKHLDCAVNFMKTMRAKGCKFYLDDFGSGLSSFGYLKDLPVDFLKIDGSFVASMEQNPSSYAMVSTFNHLAHVMKLKTVAEYVENDRVCQQLQAMGVDFGQGFGLACPEPLIKPVGIADPNSLSQLLPGLEN